MFYGWLLRENVGHIGKFKIETLLNYFTFFKNTNPFKVERIFSGAFLRESCDKSFHHHQDDHQDHGEHHEEDDHKVVKLAPSPQLSDTLPNNLFSEYIREFSIVKQSGKFETETQNLEWSNQQKIRHFEHKCYIFCHAKTKIMICQ